MTPPNSIGLSVQPRSFQVGHLSDDVAYILAGPGAPKTIAIASGMDNTTTLSRYLVFLPLRNTPGVGAVAVNAGATVQPDPNFAAGSTMNKQKPIVWCQWCFAVAEI